MDLSVFYLRVTSFFLVVLLVCFASFAITDNFFAGPSFDVHLEVSFRKICLKLYFRKVVVICVPLSLGQVSVFTRDLGVFVVTAFGAVAFIIVIAFIFVAFFAIAFRCCG